MLGAVSIVANGLAVPAADPTEPRRVAAFVAGLVADAAAMPLHWIYDTSEIAAILAAAGREDTPEFFPVSHAPFYDYPVGELTPFGEQTMVFGGAIIKHGGVDGQAIADGYTKYYTAPANMSRPWRSYYDNATKGFLANVRAGRVFPHTGDGDTETNAVAHVLPVAVMLAGRPGFLAAAEAAIRVVQDNDEAVAFGLTYARMLESVIMGGGVGDAILAVADVLGNGTGNRNDRFFAHGLRKMAEWAPRPPLDVTLEIGQGCDFPFHVFTAPHLLLHAERAAGAAVTVEDVVRQTIKLGGENANRGTFLASLVAASFGSVDAAVPAAWMSSTTEIDAIRDMGRALARLGAAPPPRPVAAAAVPWPQRTRPLAAAAGRRAEFPALRNSPGCIANSNHTTSNATRPPSHPDDFAGLRALYLSTGGPEWDRNACWLNESVPVCWWDQVLCNTTTWRVRQLRLASNNLIGTLPAEMGGLSALEDLQVGFNPGLAGDIPEQISGLASLQRLYAWNTSFTSVPASFGRLGRLIAVDLTDNQLRGALPVSLAALKTPDTVYFDGNPALQCPLEPGVERWLRAVPYHAKVC